MYEENRPFGRRWVVLAIATAAALLTSTSIALADSASISVTAPDGTSDPVAGVPRTYTLSGNVTSPKRYFVRYRPTGGAPCAGSASADTGRTVDVDYGTRWYDDDTANGNFSSSHAFTWDGSGSYLFCIWLATNSGDVVQAINQTISFRSPNGTISGSLDPVTPRPGQVATLRVTGASEAVEYVYAKVRPEGAPCAQTHSADSGSTLLRDERVDGSFSIQAPTTQEHAGNYVACLWLASSDDDTTPIAGPQPVPFTVVAPPRPCVVPAVARLTVTAARRRLARGGCSLGRVTRRYSNSVRRGRVIRSVPARGRELASGASVAVVVSKGRKKRRRR